MTVVRPQSLDAASGRCDAGWRESLFSGACRFKWRQIHDTSTTRPRHVPQARTAPTGSGGPTTWRGERAGRSTPLRRRCTSGGASARAAGACCVSVGALRGGAPPSATLLGAFLQARAADRSLCVARRRHQARDRDGECGCGGRVRRCEPPLPRHRGGRAGRGASDRRPPCARPLAHLDHARRQGAGWLLIMK